MQETSGAPDAQRARLRVDELGNGGGGWALVVSATTLLQLAMPGRKRRASVWARLVGSDGRALTATETAAVQRFLHESGLNAVPPVATLTTGGKVLLYLTNPATPQPEASRGKPLSRVRRFVVRPVGAAITSLAAVASIYGAYLIIRPAPPKRLHGDINLAVAHFNARGSHRSSGALEDSVFWLLEHERLQPAAPLEVAIGSPADMGTLGGRPNELAQRAARLARVHNADVVVYGTLRADTIESTFSPAFFLAPQKLAGAEELAGLYALGPPIRIEGDAVENPISRAAMRVRLGARVHALTELLFGLGYAQVGAHRRANQYFVSAQRAAPWDRRGDALLFQLRGNADGAQGHLRAAVRDYRKAVQIEPGYARAMFGLAEVRYQRARGACSRRTVHPAALDRASRAYARVRAAPVQPGLRIARAVLATKVELGIARIAYCEAAAGVDREPNRVRSLFTAVVRAGSHSTALGNETAEAHAYLGYLDLSTRAAEHRDRAALVAARREFELAADATRVAPRRADYLSSMAFVERRLGALPQAAASYRAAAYYETNSRRRSRLLANARTLTRAGAR